MQIANYSKNIEHPKPIDVGSVWNDPKCVRLSVPVLKGDGSYKYIGFIVDANELMKAINETVTNQ